VKGKIACGAGPASAAGGATTVTACGCHADPTCDGDWNVLDVVNVVGEAFRNVPPVTDPTCPHESRCDVDCNCVVDIGDVVRMVDVTFRNGNPATEFCNACLLPCP
jgi:hypothetical protein